MIWVLSGLTFLVILFALLTFKTLSFKSKQVETEAVRKIDIPVGAVEKLSKSVTYRTVSYYDPEAFDREAFNGFHNHLRASFPLVHTELKCEIIGTYGLLYTWEGSDKNLKPILLMAHQDVVPVEAGTEGDWTCPPFSGEKRDGFIWGRGTMDIKCCLMGTMEAVELLLKDGFHPARTVYLAYGYDEEIKGENGAKAIAALLKERGVVLEFILDEGGNIVKGTVPGMTKPVALIGNAEKGFLSLDLVVESAGGHSSMPPRETPAGILGRALHRIDHSPFPARLDGITREFFDVCGREMKFPLKTIMANYFFFRGMLSFFLSRSPVTNATIRTTAVATMLRGSSTDNILPQKVGAVVNIRIFPGESIESVKSRLAKVIADDRVKILQTGHWDSSEPAPVSSIDSMGYRNIEKSVRQVFPGVVVFPFLMVGITDSRHYRELTDNIYRFAPIIADREDLSRVHSTDERLGIENYKDMIRFYVALVKNAC